MTGPAAVSASTSGPSTTFTIFRFPRRYTWWAFAQMGRQVLSRAEGTRFCRMLGCGRHGFDKVPDFRQYAFLASWESTSAAAAFFASERFGTYAARSREHYTVWMRPVQAHGTWNDIQPFPLTENHHQEGTPLVVLTRATIHLPKLLDFWRHVPRAQAALRRSAGVLLALGVGENPITQQATVSIWDGPEAIRQFAYQRTDHKDIVKRTRQRGWYREELFARFVPVATQGTLHGQDVLQGYLAAQPLG